MHVEKANKMMKDFNYSKYLESLEESGMTLTRTWTGGIYREINNSSFGIIDNTLAPASNRSYFNLFHSFYYFCYLFSYY